MNVLNYLWILVSNVFKMFLNIFVSTGCTVVIFIRTNQPEVQTNRKHKYSLLNSPLLSLELAVTLAGAGKKEI